MLFLKWPNVPFIAYMQLLYTSEVSPSTINHQDVYKCFPCSHPSNIFVLTFDTNGWEETLMAGCCSSGAFRTRGTYCFSAVLE